MGSCFPQLPAEYPQLPAKLIGQNGTHIWCIRFIDDILSCLGAFFGHVGGAADDTIKSPRPTSSPSIIGIIQLVAVRFPPVAQGHFIRFPLPRRHWNTTHPAPNGPSYNRTQYPSDVLTFPSVPSLIYNTRGGRAYINVCVYHPGLASDPTLSVR